MTEFEDDGRTGRIEGVNPPQGDPRGLLGRKKWRGAPCPVRLRKIALGAWGSAFTFSIGDGLASWCGLAPPVALGARQIFSAQRKRHAQYLLKT
jgi:hypothetical protein